MQREDIPSRYFLDCIGLRNDAGCLAKAWSDTFAVCVHTNVITLVPYTMAPSVGQSSDHELMRWRYVDLNRLAN